MNKNTLRIIVTAFFAAVICATGFFIIPIPGLTTGVVILNAMCILTSCVIGGLWGAAPTALFFVAGVIGLPVFAGCVGGFSLLTNINGGFRIGYVLGSFTTAMICGRALVSDKQISFKYVLKLIIGVLLGFLFLYIPEIFYVIAFNADNAYSIEVVQKLALDESFVGQSIGTLGALKMFFEMYFAPFVLVDFIKAIVVILLAIKLRPLAAQYLGD